jgi:RNA polymerase sigma-70 factor (ECF subfamily)
MAAPNTSGERIAEHEPVRTPLPSSRRFDPLQLRDVGPETPIAALGSCNKVCRGVVLAGEGDSSGPFGRSVDVLDEIGDRDRTKDAFQRLAAAELPGLYSLARRLVREGAEDLVQEALTRAYRSFGTLKDDRAAGRWLKSILVNAFRDELRKRARSIEEFPVEEVEEVEGFSLYRTLVEVDPLPYSDTLHVDFLGAFGKDDMRDVLMRLPEIYRAPLVLHYMDGFSTKEIARMLEMPLGTILARLHRGRKRFERELWAYAEETGLLIGETAR